MRTRLSHLLFAFACVLAPGADAGATPAGSAEASVSGGDAQNKELAQRHFARGIEEFRAKRYKDAIDAFELAHQLYPSAAISFNIARAYESLEDAAGALRFYRDYQRQSPSAPDGEEVAKRIERLEDQLRLRGVQQVTIASKPSSATLSIDGRVMGVTPWTGELHPGHHMVELSREGYEAVSEPFNLPAHRALDVELELAPVREEREAPVAAPAPSSPLVEQPEPSFARYLPWLSWGAAGVALGAAGYFELASRSAEKDAQRAPSQSEALAHVDEMQSAQTAARVLVGTGAALVVAGGVLFWVTSEDAEEPALAIGCSITECAMRGAF